MRHFLILIGLFLYCPISSASETANYSHVGCINKSNQVPLPSYERLKNSPPTRALITEVLGTAKTLVQSGQCQQAEKLYTLIATTVDQAPAIDDDLRFEAITKLILIFSAQRKYAEMGLFLPEWLALRQHETTKLNSELGMAYFGVSEYYFLRDQLSQAEKYGLLAIENVEVDERFFAGMIFQDRLRSLYDHIAAVYYRERRYAQGETARTKVLRDPSKNYVTSVRPENAAEKKERLRAEIINLFSKGNAAEAIDRFRSVYEDASNAEISARQSLIDAQAKLGILRQQELSFIPVS